MSQTLPQPPPTLRDRLFSLLALLHATSQVAVRHRYHAPWHDRGCDGEAPGPI